MAYFVLNPIGSYQAIADTSTTQQHYLGYRVQAYDATYYTGEFIYCTGVASTIATDWVTIVEDYATVRLVADSKAPVGVAMSANVASSYGFYQIYGKAIGGSGGAITDGAQIYAHGTAGLVDDAVVAGDVVYNAYARSTISGASITGQYQIAYPFTNDLLLVN